MGVLVSTSYQGAQIGMIQKLPHDMAEFWEQYPVALTPPEEKSSGVREIMPFMIEQDRYARLPSRLAGLSADKVESELLESMDKAYKKAVRGYHALLFDATIQDCEVLKDRKCNFRIAEEHSWWWRLISFWGQPFISKEAFQRDTQAQRHDWIVRVHTLESQRTVRIRCDIEATVPKLAKQLKELDKSDLRRPKIQREIEQLERLYKAITKSDLRPQLEQQVK